MFLETGVPESTLRGIENSTPGTGRSGVSHLVKSTLSIHESRNVAVVEEKEKEERQQATKQGPTKLETTMDGGCHFRNAASAFMTLSPALERKGRETDEASFQ
jgi:hypothetical protein